MFIPIRDENRSQKAPHITRILIIINITVFILLLSFLILFPEDARTREFKSLYESLRMVPTDILQAKNLHTLFTSMFLHADILHLGGNMLFLYIFGDNVEDAFGHFRYLLFFLVCGLAADFAHIFSLTTPMEFAIPTLGASGAISGVMGAYILMYPRARIRTLIFAGYFITVVSVPAVFFLGFWFLLQLLYAWVDIGGGVAYWAHVGGFAAGMVLALIVRRRKRKQPKPVTP